MGRVGSDFCYPPSCLVFFRHELLLLAQLAADETKVEGKRVRYLLLVIWLTAEDLLYEAGNHTAQPLSGAQVSKPQVRNGQQHQTRAEPPVGRKLAKGIENETGQWMIRTRVFRIIEDDDPRPFG